jgi:hypothetical protein
MVADGGTSWSERGCDTTEDKVKYQKLGKSYTKYDTSIRVSCSECNTKESL